MTFPRPGPWRAIATDTQALQILREDEQRQGRITCHACLVDEAGVVFAFFVNSGGVNKNELVATAEYIAGLERALEIEKGRADDLEEEADCFRQQCDFRQQYEREQDALESQPPQEPPRLPWHIRLFYWLNRL